MDLRLLKIYPPYKTFFIKFKRTQVNNSSLFWPKMLQIFLIYLLLSLMFCVLYR